MGVSAVAIERGKDGAVVVRLAGRWRMGTGVGATTEVDVALAEPPLPTRLRFDSGDVESWDTSLLLFATRVVGRAAERGVAVDRDGLPEGVRQLLGLSEARASSPPPPAAVAPHWVGRLGNRTIDAGVATHRFVRFVGETTLAVGRFVRGRARYRGVDLVTEIQSAGAGALGIVVIVGFLVGMILSFVGAVTLRPFGATIYTADVVTIGLVRELGPIMTAIVMAGRTGSAYAAQLGTMRVNEEIDALSSMSLPPMEFLVLPRTLALTIMMPLLCIYTDFVGLVGGGLVATGMLDQSVTVFVQESRQAITLTIFWIGIAKCAVFGVLVAISGCSHGMRADKSAAAVGKAATSAVVTSIIWVIAADGVFAVLLYMVGL